MGFIRDLGTFFTIQTFFTIPNYFSRRKKPSIFQRLLVALRLLPTLFLTLLATYNLIVVHFLEKREVSTLTGLSNIVLLIDIIAMRGSILLLIYFSWRQNYKHLKVIDAIVDFEKHFPDTKGLSHIWCNIQIVFVLFYVIILNCFFNVVSNAAVNIEAHIFGILTIAEVCYIDFIMLYIANFIRCFGNFIPKLLLYAQKSPVNDVFKLFEILTEFFDVMSSINHTFGPLISTSFLQHLTSCCLTTYISFWLCFTSGDFPNRNYFIITYFMWGIRGFLFLIFMSMYGEKFAKQVL